MIYFEATKDNPIPATEIIGVHMAEVKSMTLKHGETHMVVIRDGDLVHDPNPNAKEVGDMLGVYVFVALDAADWAKRKE